VEKFFGLLWVNRTTKRVPTGETLFSLVYEMEVVIAVDICKLTFRTGEIYWDHNAIQLCLSQDQSEEMLAQRPITLVLMMINSCSYSLLIILCLNSFSD